MIARVLLIVIVAAVASFGFICLIRPAKIQSCVLRMQRDNWAWRLNPFRERMKRESYLIYLRWMGVFLLLWAFVAVAGVVLSH